MRRFVTAFLSVLMIFALAAPAFATEATEETLSRPENACGDDLTWTYASGKLTITGTGQMDDFSDGAPWDDYAGSIYILELSGGVTTIGAGAFAGFTNLTDIDFGDSLREIGENAFRGCTSIATISLPASFRLFGPSSFEGCTGLTEVHCAGGMPSFRTNCLWNGGHITIYCPDNNIWAEKYVGELETNFGGRLEVLTESGKDVYVWPEETTQPTEEATEPTTEATSAPTTAPAEAPTEEATTPATVPTTQAPSAPARETEPYLPSPEDTPTVQEREPINGVLVAVFLLSGTLSLLLIGMLIFKGTRRGGKYSR